MVCNRKPSYEINIQLLHILLRIHGAGGSCSLSSPCIFDPQSQLLLHFITSIVRVSFNNTLVIFQNKIGDISVKCPLSIILKLFLAIVGCFYLLAYLCFIFSFLFLIYMLVVWCNNWIMISSQENSYHHIETYDLGVTIFSFLFWCILVVIVFFPGPGLEPKSPITVCCLLFTVVA